MRCWLTHSYDANLSRLQQAEVLPAVPAGALLGDAGDT